MTATIDPQGRIRLDPEVQRQLGVKPGDEVAIENRNGQWVLSPVGLVTENGVLVHRGTSPVSADDLLALLREERFVAAISGSRPSAALQLSGTNHPDFPAFSPRLHAGGVADCSQG